MAAIAYVPLTGSCLIPKAYFPVDILESEDPKERHISERAILELGEREEGSEELLFLPTTTIDSFFAEQREIEENLSVEKAVAKGLIYSLTIVQVDAIRRVILEPEAEGIEGIAKTYGVLVSDVHLAISCALDELENWKQFPAINRVVTLGRKMGF